MTREVTLSDFPCYLEMSRYVRRLGPFDVIHAHSTKAGFLARLLVNTHGAKMVYTSHGLMTLDPSLRGLRRRAVCALESTLARWSASVVAVSANERRCALETGIDPAKLAVVPNGIRPPAIATQARQREEIRVSLGLSADTVLIGYVGRFFWYKNPARVIEAFALLKQKSVKPSRLAMIGWGPLEAESAAPRGRA